MHVVSLENVHEGTHCFLTATIDDGCSWCCCCYCMTRLPDSRLPFSRTIKIDADSCVCAYASFPFLPRRRPIFQLSPVPGNAVFSVCTTA